MDGHLKTPFFERENYNIQNPTPEKFTICYSYGCLRKADVSFSNVEWQVIRDVFVPQPSSPEQERETIIKALTHIEIMVGGKTGTSKDIGGTFPGLFITGQMDCEDEAVNGSVYLTMLIEQKLIHFHTLTGIARRGFSFRGWPHMAAMVTDTQTQEDWVVDTWFLDNGEPPFILPVQIWKDGWRPTSDLE